MGLPPKNLYNKRFENISLFRCGLHPYKLATLRARSYSSVATLLLRKSTRFHDKKNTRL